MNNLQFNELKTPVYVIDEKKLIHNLTILKDVEERTGCHILQAQKAFSAYSEYPLIGKYISGTTASGLFEAKLVLNVWERKTTSLLLLLLNPI